MHSLVLRYLQRGRYLLPSRRQEMLSRADMQDVGFAQLLAPFAGLQHLANVENDLSQDADLGRLVADLSQPARDWLEAATGWPAHDAAPQRVSPSCCVIEVTGAV